MAQVPDQQKQWQNHLVDFVQSSVKSPHRPQRVFDADKVGAMRIVGICTDMQEKKRFSELKSLLLAINYPQISVDRSIKKARSIPRNIALRKVVKQKLSEASVCNLT